MSGHPAKYFCQQRNKQNLERSKAIYIVSHPKTGRKIEKVVVRRNCFGQNISSEMSVFLHYFVFRTLIFYLLIQVTMIYIKTLVQRKGFLHCITLLVGHVLWWPSTPRHDVKRPILQTEVRVRWKFQPARFRPEAHVYF